MNTIYLIVLLFFKCIFCSSDKKKKTIISKRRNVYNRIEQPESFNTGRTNKTTTSTAITTISNKNGSTEKDETVNSPVATLTTRFQRTEVRRFLPTLGLVTFLALVSTVLTTLLNVTSPHFRINLLRKLFYILQIFFCEDYGSLLELCEVESDRHKQFWPVLGISHSIERATLELIEPGKWMGECEGWGLRVQTIGVAIWITFLIAVFDRICQRLNLIK